MRNLHRRWIKSAVAVAAITGAAVLTACSSGASSSAVSSSPAQSPASSASSAAPAASASGASTAASATPTLLSLSPAQALAAAYKGTFGAPPATGPAAVSGKSVWVVSCGQAAYSCSIPAGYAMQAVSKIGWTGHLCDGKLDPTTESTCVQQATAAGANAILLAGIDCSGLVGQLQTAKAAGLLIIDPLGFDCNDPHVGGNPVFSGNSTYAGGETLQAYMTDWGASRAAWIIGASHGTAQVIDVTLDGVLTPTYADAGFQQMMVKCSGCKVVDTVHLTLADLGSGAAQQKVATALQSNPSATYLDSPFDSAIPAFIAGSVKDSGRKNLQIMGDECFPLNLGYVGTGGPESACSALVEAWDEWAAVDDLNRLFSGESAAQLPDSGNGFQLVDKTHNLGPANSYNPPVNFEADYEKVWGK
jgi:ribose transport system substrate-binding protein